MFFVDVYSMHVSSDYFLFGQPQRGAWLGFNNIIAYLYYIAIVMRHIVTVCHHSQSI